MVGRFEAFRSLLRSGIGYNFHYEGELEHLLQLTTLCTSLTKKKEQRTLQLILFQRMTTLLMKSEIPGTKAREAELALRAKLIGKPKNWQKARLQVQKDFLKDFRSVTKDHRRPP